jgi:hypothetical protein
MHFHMIGGLILLSPHGNGSVQEDIGVIFLFCFPWLCWFVPGCFP